MKFGIWKTNPVRFWYGGMSSVQVIVEETSCIFPGSFYDFIVETSQALIIISFKKIFII